MMAETRGREARTDAGATTVGSVMTTDLLTVRPTERLDLAALVMDRRQIRQLLVVDPDGRFLGLVSYRALIRLMAARRTEEVEEGSLVEEYMDADPVTVASGTPLRDAVRLMLDRDVSAVPVVDDDRVVGILSEHDVVRVTGALLERGPGPDTGSGLDSGGSGRESGPGSPSKPGTRRR